MEAWTTVIVAFIVAASTLGATFLQNWHSEKRFKKELEKAKEDAQRQRRWEVRSPPLLKLREELARMTAKQERLVSAAHSIHTRVGGTEEQAREQLKEAATDWNSYVAGGDSTQTLFLQFDTELIRKIEEIISDYRASYLDALYYKELKATELGKAMEVFQRNKNLSLKHRN